MKNILIALSIIFLAGASVSADKKFTPAAWQSIRKNYDLFLNKPTSGHARKLARSLPAKPLDLSTEDPARDETALYIFDDQRFGHFKNVVRNKKPAYLGLLFRMLYLADEDNTEELEEQIGLYIPALAEQFLKAVEGYSDYQLRGIFGNFAEEYDADNNKRLEELKLNLAAIEKVRGRRYDKLKRRCVDILKVFIEERESRKE